MKSKPKKDDIIRLCLGIGGDEYFSLMAENIESRITHKQQVNEDTFCRLKNSRLLLKKRLQIDAYEITLASLRLLLNPFSKRTAYKPCDCGQKLNQQHILECQLWQKARETAMSANNIGKFDTVT